MSRQVRNGPSDVAQGVGIRSKFQDMRAALLSGFLAVACAGTPSADPGPVSLHLLAFSDFHGRLLPDGKGRGGVAQLAHAIERLRRPQTRVVSQGDLVGASPLISSHFRDEPTIEVMNAIGLDLFSIGNHEFDEGVEELLRLERGGPHPSLEATDPEYVGARFRFLAANTLRAPARRPLFEPYHLIEIQGVQVAFIGLAPANTPSMVAPSLEGLVFEDEVEVVRKHIRELGARGVNAFVLLLHEGGRHEGGPNGCKNLEGRIVDLMERMPDEVDLVLSGHTHRAYVCELEDIPVVSAGAYGRFLSDIELELSPRTKDVVSVRSENVPIFGDGPQSPKIQAMVDEYRARVSRIAERQVGEVARDIPRHPTPSGESLLGSIIADAQREATKADLAFMNLGGIRDDLLEGPATYGQLFRIQPFDNQMVTIELEGREVVNILQGQWSVEGEFGLFQISQTLEYCWDPSKPDGEKVDVSTVRVRGEAVDMDRTYVVAVNSYLARKPPFAKGRAPTLHGKDVEAFETWVQRRSPLRPPEPGRICLKNPGGTQTSQGPKSETAKDSAG